MNQRTNEPTETRTLRSGVHPRGGRKHLRRHGSPPAPPLQGGDCAPIDGEDETEGSSRAVHASVIAIYSYAVHASVIAIQTPVNDEC